MQMFLLLMYVALVIYQTCLGYGTAYRLTKEGADNGVSLFGWMLLMTLAALVPVLGFYLWHKNKNIDVPEDALTKKLGSSTNDSEAGAPAKRKGFFGSGRPDKRKNQQKPDPNITCDKCGRVYESYIKACPGCGKRDMDRRHG